MVLGTASTLLLIYLSPTIQVDILGNADAPFPLRNPALLTIPLAFITAIGVSLLSADRTASEGYAQVERQMHLGVRTEG
jgi:cation/acetate symporter